MAKMKQNKKCYLYNDIQMNKLNSKVKDDDMNATVRNATMTLDETFDTLRKTFDKKKFKSFNCKSNLINLYQIFDITDLLYRNKFNQMFNEMQD